MDDESLEQIRQQIGKLTNEYWLETFRYARGLTKDHDDANDLTQEAFMRTFMYLRDHPEFNITNPRAWLLTLVKRTYLNQQQRRRLMTDSIERKNRWDTDYEEDPLQNIPDCSNDANPVRILEEKEAENSFYNSIDELVDDTKMRQMLKDHIIGGKKIREIAEELNVSLDSVKKYILGVKKKLKVRIKRVDIKEE